ncbi:MAG: hypothetical protein J7647_27215 [Cyanobacteria bacterium SBLK]|nr:hypothetical protein [Cyanobacteria bacterium SBLK]
MNIINLSKRRTKFLIAISAIIGLCFCLLILRINFGLHHDDTSVLLYQRGPTYPGHVNDAIGFWFRPRAEHMRAYRPIAHTYQLLQSLIYQHLGLPFCAAINLFFLGLSGFFVFLLADYLFGGYIGVISSFSFILFPQEISANWVLFGPQALVPGLMCFSLLLYLKYLNGSKKNLIYLLLILIISPLFKEAIGLISFVIFFHYCFLYFAKTLGSYSSSIHLGKFSWTFAISMSIACFQSIFPSFFVNFLIFSNPALISIFEMGPLHDHLSALNPKESLFMDILASIPPSLIISSLLTLILSKVVLNSKRSLKIFSIHNLQKQAILIMSSILLIAYIFFIFSDNEKMKILFIFFYLSFLGILFATRYSLLIVIWLSATLFSLFSVYFNTTQLGYLAPQIIIIISVITKSSIADLYKTTLQQTFLYKKVVHWLIGSIAFLCILSFIDTSTSVANAFSGYAALDKLVKNEEIQQYFSSQCRDSISDRNIYLSNSPLIMDIAFHSLGYKSLNLGNLKYNSFFGVPPSEVIKSKKQLQNLLINNNVYLVRLESPNPYKPILWKTENLEKSFSKTMTFETSFTTYYFDPLRRILDNRYRDLVINPDFQDEYKLQKKSMFKTTYANTVYISHRCAAKVDQDFLLPIIGVIGDLPIELVVDGYKAFNIIKANDLFYGLARIEGAFELEKVQKGEYDHLIIGNSIEEVKAGIDEKVKTMNNDERERNQIRLVIEGYKKFNIIEMNGRFYAILQAEGTFSLDRIEKQDYSLFFIGDSIEEVQAAIDNQ